MRLRPAGITTSFNIIVLTNSFSLILPTLSYRCVAGSLIMGLYSVPNRKIQQNHQCHDCTPITEICRTSTAILQLHDYSQITKYAAETL